MPRHPLILDGFCRRSTCAETPADCACTFYPVFKEPPTNAPTDCFKYRRQGNLTILLSVHQAVNTFFRCFRTGSAARKERSNRSTESKTAEDRTRTQPETLSATKKFAPINPEQIFRPPGQVPLGLITIRKRDGRVNHRPSHSFCSLNPPPSSHLNDRWRRTRPESNRTTRPASTPPLSSSPRTARA